MTHIGIDYSMTCPAACAISSTGAEFWYAHESKHPILSGVTSVGVDTEASVIQRGTTNGLALTSWLSRFDHQHHVNIEDYAFNATGRVFHIGEHTGCLKFLLHQQRFDVHVIPPTVIKKFATGKGNADKPRMTAAFLDAYPPARAWIREFFPRFTPTTSPAKSPLADLADAFWIARYAASK